MDDDEVEQNFDAIVRNQPTRMTLLLTGVITVEDLDDEELLRGQTRNVNGHFSGPGAQMIPRAMHLEIQRRLQKRGAMKVQEHLFEAIDVVSGIMNDTNVDPSVRLNAAKYVWERVAGKTPDKVEVAMEVKRYETVMDSVLRVLPDDEGVFRVPDDTDDDDI